MPVPRRSLRVDARSLEPDETTIGEAIMSGSVSHTQPAQTDQLRGTAMRPTIKFTKEDAQLPYTAMALLDVCALAMNDLEDTGTAGHTRRYAGSVSIAIKHTLDVLVGFHEKLDRLGRLEVSE